MIVVKSDVILDEYIGGSEKNMKMLFKLASDESCKSGHPTIIVIDEIDSLFGSTGRNDCKTEANIVTQLLTLMQGVEPPEGEIVVIGITNHERKLPEALRSRFNFIHVGLPANADELRAILKLHVGKRDVHGRNVLTEDDYTMLSNKLFEEKASGRDAEKMVENAVDIVTMQTLDAKFWRKDVQYDRWIPCGEDRSEHEASRGQMRAMFGNDKLSMPSLSVEHFTEAIETYGVNAMSDWGMRQE